MSNDGVLLDITDQVTYASNGKKGRTSFYTLPKTFSEDDDPFGIFCANDSKSSKEVKQVEDENLLKLAEPSTGLLVQIDTESPQADPCPANMSRNSVSCNRVPGPAAASQLAVPSHPMDVSPLVTPSSANFGNLSTIGETPSFSNRAEISDEVFIQGIAVTFYCLN